MSCFHGELFFCLIRTFRSSLDKYSAEYHSFSIFLFYLSSLFFSVYSFRSSSGLWNNQILVYQTLQLNHILAFLAANSFERVAFFCFSV